MPIEAYFRCIMPEHPEKFPIDQILTSCNKCGNQLDLEYDMDGDIFRSSLAENLGIGNNINDEKLLDGVRQRMADPGNIFNESGVWRFREFLPFFGDSGNYEKYSQVLASLDGREGQTRPIPLNIVAEYVGLKPNKLYGQLEGWNPTGSFKDNGMAAATTHWKMLNSLYGFDIRALGCASTGNTASSASAYARNEGIDSIIFVGEGRIALGKLAQALLYGAQIMQIEGGDFDDAMELIKDAAPQIGIYPVNSLTPPRIEGQKTIIYRLLEGLHWDPPDVIALPGGNIGNTASFGKALQELHDLDLIKKIPKLLVVNAEGANTFSQLVNVECMTWNNGNPDLTIRDGYYAMLDDLGTKAYTEASAIEILKPQNLLKGLRSLEYTNGSVIEVTDEEIFEAQKKIGENAYGCEPASAASVAGIKKAIEQGIIDPEGTVVAILTGHELKDPEAVINHHKEQMHTVKGGLDNIVREVRSLVFG